MRRRRPIRNTRRAGRARRPAPAPSGDEPAPRLLGQLYSYRDALWFRASGRVRYGNRRLAPIRGQKIEPGDYVIAELPRWEEEAVVVEVLGREDDPSWDNLAVRSKYRWPDRFSKAARQEVSRARPPRGGTRGREDLRDLVTFTMDPVDAADFDDALSWRLLEDGLAEVGVHIADVSHYVAPGGAVDREARARATSVYLSGDAVPMLPEKLSSDLCSLRPGLPRFTVSVLARMDEAGEVHDYRLVEGCIESRARLTYEEGEAILDGGRRGPAEVRRALVALGELTDRLIERRRHRGALDLDTEEVRAEVDKDGRPVALHRKERLRSHRVVEELMLLANTLVAEEAELRGSPFLFRVHDPPPQASLAILESQLKALGLPRLGGTERVGGALQRLLEYRVPAEKQRLVHHLVLRSLTRARYDARRSVHFGLALQSYSHFTSPIRRYPDLFNHRQVVSWIREGRGHGGARFGGAMRSDVQRRASADLDSGIAELAHHASLQESAAQDAERESLRVKSLRFAEPFLGEERTGTIVGLVPKGVFVELDDPPVEGFCSVREAIDDRFDLDEARVRLVGRRTGKRFHLGDRVRAQIVRIDIAARELDLTLSLPRSRKGLARGRKTRRVHKARRRGGRK